MIRDLWEKCKNSPYIGDRDIVNHTAVMQTFYQTNHATVINNNADELEEGHVKVSHKPGCVARCKWNNKANNYTGLFEPESVDMLCRISVAFDVVVLSTEQQSGVQLALALKAAAPRQSTNTSVNILANGIDFVIHQEENFFQHVISNEIPFMYSQREIAFRRYQAPCDLGNMVFDMTPFAGGNYESYQDKSHQDKSHQDKSHAGQYNPDYVRAPTVVYFKPTNELLEIGETLKALEFRDVLKTIPCGTVLYTVHDDNTYVNPAIAELVLTEQFFESQFADEQLHFYHNIRQEEKLRATDDWYLPITTTSSLHKLLKKIPLLLTILVFPIYIGLTYLKYIRVRNIIAVIFGIYDIGLIIIAAGLFKYIVPQSSDLSLDKDGLIYVIDFINAMFNRQYINGIKQIFSPDVFSLIISNVTYYKSREPLPKIVLKVIFTIIAIFSQLICLLVDIYTIPFHIILQRTKQPKLKTKFQEKLQDQYLSKGRCQQV